MNISNFFAIIDLVKAARTVDPRQLDMFASPPPSPASAGHSRRAQKPKSVQDQLDMFEVAAQKTAQKVADAKKHARERYSRDVKAGRRPPGVGWSRVPNSKYGGWRRRKKSGKGWEYWYPEKVKALIRRTREDRAKAKKKADRAKDEPRLVVHPDVDITSAMSEKKGKKARKDDNEKALAIVEAARAEGRGLTDDEAVQVAAYSGEGGISGDLNQYYTRTDIAQSLWKLMGIYQDDLERVLEPACGSGVFLATAPDGTKCTGVEIDEKAAAVAEALHGSKHVVASSSLEEWSIERIGTPQNFDAVVTNAPFCTRTGDIPRHKPEIRSADRYFIDTSLDHVKDGGLVTMIVHNSVMGSKDADAKEFRERMLCRAEVVDAFRLPTEAFDHTHATVVSDVIVLRKRDSVVGNALVEAKSPDAFMGDAWDQAFVDGDYFDAHPDRILGVAKTAEETGWRSTVTGNAKEAAEKIVSLTEDKIKHGLQDVDGWKRVTREDIAKHPEGDGLLKLGESGVADFQRAPTVGDVMQIAGGKYLYVGTPPKWKPLESVDDVTQIVEQTGDAALKKAHLIALDISDLIEARKNGEFYRARGLRRAIASKVNAWVEENGLPAEHRALEQLAKSAPVLLDFIACVNADGALSDVLSKDVASTFTAASVDKKDLGSVARFVARHGDGVADLDTIQHNWEGWESESKSAIKQTLIETGDWCIDTSNPDVVINVEDYLSGDLYEKRDRERQMLDGADATDFVQIQKQIDMLSKAIETKRKPIDDVHFQLRNIGWMPIDVFRDFLKSEKSPLPHFLRDSAEIFYTDGMYVVEYKTFNYGLKGERVQTTGRTGDFDFLLYMNRMSLRKERVEDVVNHVEENFNEWIKESDHRAEIEEIYNRTFNSRFAMEFSDATLDLEGMNPDITPHPFQNQAVRWADAAGSGILAQDVGLGKTFIALLLAKYRKQKGKSKNPVVVVPKSVATNWMEEAETLFPGSKVLVIGEHLVQTAASKKKARKDGISRGLEGAELEAWVAKQSVVARSDNDEQRNVKLAQMKQNDYDLVIITKPAFERIPLKAETVEAYEHDDFWYQHAKSIDKAKGSKTQATADKKIERLKADWAGKKLAEKFKHNESLIYWEDLGVDTLIVDEAHAYKNLYAAKTRFGHAPKFLGGSMTSKQARKMQHMSRFVRDANPGTNGVFMLTATPTKNSPLEVFNMLQHVAPEEFHRIGINNSEDFIDRYCTIEERQVLAPPGRSKAQRGKDDEDGDFSGAGNLENAQCVVGFQNLKELEVVTDAHMLVQTATDVGLKIPTAHDDTHVIEMSGEQKLIYEQLRDEASSIVNTGDEEKGKLFKIFDKMKKAAQDLELYDPEEYKGWSPKSPKYQAAVKEIVKGVKERGGQIVFCDHNDTHERVKAMLVAEGIPPERIGIINAKVAKDSDARQKIGNMFNDGTLDVVIGNTSTMGEGVNLQGKHRPDGGTTDIHHLDQPWDPGSIQQRNGRGVRQGNPAEDVHIHTYLSAASFDGFRHSTVKGKERWLDRLRSGADSIENDMGGQNIDDAEMLAMLSDDPESALEAVGAQRAAAEEAWKARKAAEASARVEKYFKRLNRLKRMKRRENADPSVIASLESDLARTARRIIRDPATDPAVADYIEHGGGNKMGVIQGPDDEGKTASVIAKVGDVFTSDRNGSEYCFFGFDKDGNPLMTSLSIHDGWPPVPVKTDVFLKKESFNYVSKDEKKSPVDVIIDNQSRAGVSTHASEMLSRLVSSLRFEDVAGKEGAIDRMIRDSAKSLPKWASARSFLVDTPNGVVYRPVPEKDLDSANIVWPWTDDGRRKIAESLADDRMGVRGELGDGEIPLDKFADWQVMIPDRYDNESPGDVRTMFAVSDPHRVVRSVSETKTIWEQVVEDADAIVAKRKKEAA